MQMVRIYNQGEVPFEFTHGGNLYTIFPKNGRFERKKEAYEVYLNNPMAGPRQSKPEIRYRDVWVRVAEEHRNSNFADIPKDGFSVAMRAAEKQGLIEQIKTENQVVKEQEDRLKEVEAKVQEREKELNLKLIMLQKLEQEAVTKTAVSRK